MQDVLQVVSLDGLFRIEQFEELLYKLWCNIDLEGFNVYGFIYDKLEEELVNSLEVGPGGVHFIFLLNTCF